MKARLYAVPASHPSAAVEAALRLKGIEFERVDLVPFAHRIAQARRFRGMTVPGLELDGERILGSRAIMRALDAHTPDPPLLPDDPQRLAALKRAEEWGEEVLQPIARRIVWGALARNPAALETYAAPTRPPVPAPVGRAIAPLIARLGVVFHGAMDTDVQVDLLHLDAHLVRVEDWMADGLLGGERPNAADLQIASSVRLLLTLGDLRAALDARPAGAPARRWFPSYPGDCPAGALPAGWLGALGGSSVAAKRA